MICLVPKDNLKSQVNPWDDLDLYAINIVSIINWDKVLGGAYDFLEKVGHTQCRAAPTSSTQELTDIICVETGFELGLVVKQGYGIVAKHNWSISSKEAQKVLDGPVSKDAKLIYKSQDEFWDRLLDSYDGKSLLWLPVNNDNKAMGGCILVSRHKIDLNACKLECMCQAQKMYSILLGQVKPRINPPSQLQVFDNFPALVWSMDVKGDYNYFNQAWLEFTGESLDNQLLHPMREKLIHPDDSKDFQKKCREMLDIAQPLNHEYRLLRHDGLYRWVADYGSPYFNPDGSLAGFIGFCYDITEKKAISDIHRQREELYSSLFVNNQSVMLLVDPETGGIVDANRAAQKFYGYENILDKTIFDINSLPNDEIRKAISKVSSQSHNSFDFRHYLADGQLRDVTVFSGPIIVQDRVLLYTIVHDTTENNRAQADMHKIYEKNIELANRNRLLLDSSGEGILGVDAKGKCSFVNHTACKMLGYLESELLGQCIHSLIHHSRLDGSPFLSSQCQMNDTIVNGNTHTVDKDLFWCKDGSPLFIRYISNPIIESGKVTGAVITFSDISKRMAMENALIESQRFATAVADGLSAQVLALDDKGRILKANKAWFDMADILFPQRDFEFLGKSFLAIARLLPGNLQRVGVEAVNKITAVIQGKLSEATLEFQGPETSGGRWYIGRARRYSGHENIKVIVTIEDITEIIWGREEMRRAKEAAEHANSAKSEFLASMSHEIRTPLNAIIGIADLLWESGLSSEQQKYVRIFRGAGDHLLSLINNLLDLARIEHGPIDIDSVQMDMVELVEEVAEFLAVAAHQKGLELVAHVNPDISPIRIGDPNRIRQILVNMLGNAIKFTHSGEVTLWVDEDSSGSVLFKVIDTGIGIPENKLETVFGQFDQGSESTAKRYGGSGLGLAVSKRLAKLMGGDITVESKVGQGCTFIFSVPLAVASSVAVTDYSNLITGPVLIVDDNETNRVILRQLLGRQGIEVFEASGGESGLKELARAKEAGRPYQLVLLDRWMPGMDGFNVVEAIRENKLAEDTVILMLTSSNRNIDVERCKQIGISAYLVKPIKKAELFAAMVGVLGGAIDVATPAATVESRNLVY